MFLKHDPRIHLEISITGFLLRYSQKKSGNKIHVDSLLISFPLDSDSELAEIYKYLAAKYYGNFASVATPLSSVATGLNFSQDFSAKCFHESYYYSKTVSKVSKEEIKSTLHFPAYMFRLV